MSQPHYDIYSSQGATPPPMGGLFEADWARIGFEGDPFDEAPPTAGAGSVPPPPMPPVAVSAAPEEDEPLPSGIVSLRDYQKTAVDNILDAHNSGIMSALAVSATGTGKSVMLAELTRRYLDSGQKVLVLVHRDELIRQLVNSCARMGIAVGVEKAQEDALPGFGHFHDVVCASVQTMQGARLERWPVDAFGLVIIDEAHHAISKTYANILRRFGWTPQTPENGPYIAGFTATPDRLDKKNIGALFQTLAFEYSLRSAVKDGYLAKPRVLTLETDPQIDLRGISKIGKKDFSPQELEETIVANLTPIANSLAQCEALRGRKSILFTPDTESSKMMADALEKVGISANWVAGYSRDRRQKLEAHKRGDYQVLCNCMLTTEGYDDPDISAVILCRPTKSRGLKSQMVGRGTRLAAGKDGLIVVDFNWLIDDKTLVKATELFDDGSIDDAIIEIARELEDEAKGERDIEELLVEAESIHRERIRERIRRQKIPMRGKMFDPLGLADMFEIPTHKDGYEWANVRTATSGQIEALQKWNIAVSAELPFSVAKAMLDKVITRHKHGWTSMGQINALVETGMDSDVARGMRKDEAKQYLDDWNKANPQPATSGQQWFLKTNGYTQSQVTALTKAEASQIIAKMKGNPQ